MRPAAQMGSGEGKQEATGLGCLGMSVPKEETALQSPEGRAGSGTQTGWRGQIGGGEREGAFRW